MFLRSNLIFSRAGIASFAVLLALCLFCQVGNAQADKQIAVPEVKDAETSPKNASYQLKIHTPITAAESIRVRVALTSIQESSPNATVLISFKGDDEEATQLGQGSEYEASLAIARLLIGPIGGKIRSIAYVDKPLVGHAVLVALACEKIAVSPSAELGAVSTGEGLPDETVLLTYQNIADQRGRFPLAFVVSMIDPNAQLFDVSLNDGQQRYVNQSELDALTKANSVVRQTRLTTPGQLGNFQGKVLRAKNFIDYSPATVEELQADAQIPVIEVFAAPEAGDNVKPVVFSLKAPITPLLGNRCVRVIRESVSKNGSNVCFFEIDSLGGSIEECNRLASFILDLNSEGIKTCAVIDNRCNGGAALIAMACSKCYTIKGSQFGGNGDPVYTETQIIELKGLWENLSGMSGKPEGQFYSVISSSLPLHEYTSNAGGRTIGTPKLMDGGGNAIQWQIDPQAAPVNEVNLEIASRLGWIAGTVASTTDIAKLYGLDQMPAPVQLSQLEEFLSQLAENQSLHWFLFTIGLITFTTELTAPGGIVFGFISFVCFATFFWLKMLNGTVDGLEIMLFISGIACICMEVFVIPGFGIFGIGGITMCIAGAVLASQRFVIPVTSVQWHEFAWNTLTVAAISLGSIVFLVAMSSRLSNSKFFKRLELQAPTNVSQSSDHEIEDLTGASGTTLTRCAPYGMAKIHGHSHEVRTEDAYIGEGQEIIVTAMQGPTAIIKQKDGAAA